MHGYGDVDVDVGIGSGETHGVSFVWVGLDWIGLGGVVGMDEEISRLRKGGPKTERGEEEHLTGLPARGQGTSACLSRALVARSPLPILPWRFGSICFILCILVFDLMRGGCVEYGEGGVKRRDYKPGKRGGNVPPLSRYPCAARAAHSGC